MPYCGTLPSVSSAISFNVFYVFFQKRIIFFIVYYSLRVQYRFLFTTSHLPNVRYHYFFLNILYKGRLLELVKMQKRIFALSVRFVFRVTCFQMPAIEYVPLYFWGFFTSSCFIFFLLFKNGNLWKNMDQNLRFKTNPHSIARLIATFCTISFTYFDNFRINTFRVLFC